MLIVAGLHRRHLEHLQPGPLGEGLLDRAAVLEAPGHREDPAVVGIPVHAGDLLGVAVDQADPVDHRRLGEGEGDRLAGRVAGHPPRGAEVAVVHLAGLVGHQVAVEVGGRRCRVRDGERAAGGQLDALADPLRSLGGLRGRPPRGSRIPGSGLGAEDSLAPGSVAGSSSPSVPNAWSSTKTRPTSSTAPSTQQIQARPCSGSSPLEVVDLLVGEQVLVAGPTPAGARSGTRAGGSGSGSGSARLRRWLNGRDRRHRGRVRGLHGKTSARCR